MAAVRNANMSASDAYLAQFEAQANQAPTTDERPTSFECCGCLSPNRATIGEGDPQTSQVAYRALEVEQTPPAECCLDSSTRVCAKTLVVIVTVILFVVATGLTGGLAAAAVAGGYAVGMQALWIGFTIAFGFATAGAAFVLPDEYKMCRDTGHNREDSLQYFGNSLIFLFDCMGRAIDWAREVSWWGVMDGTPAPASQGCPSCSESPSCHELARCCDTSNCQGCDFRCELPTDCRCDCQGCDANCCPNF